LCTLCCQFCVDCPFLLPLRYSQKVKTNRTSFRILTLHSLEQDCSPGCIFKGQYFAHMWEILASFHQEGRFGTIILVFHWFFFIEVPYQARKPSGHVYVCMLGCSCCMFCKCRIGLWRRYQRGNQDDTMVNNVDTPRRSSIQYI
jgi:hypothetical protein